MICLLGYLPRKLPAGTMKFQFFVLCAGLLIFILTLFNGTMLLNLVATRRKFLNNSSYLLQNISNVTTSHSVISSISTPFRESVTLDDGVYNYHLNLSRFQAEFPHLQNYICSILHTPETDSETTRPLVIMAIKSHPSTKDRRKALRQTWARQWDIDGYRLKPIFLVGRTDNLGQMEIVTVESKEYGDILQWDFSEGHHNLSLKERCFLEWLHHHFPQVDFIFKGDDDEFVNPRAIVQHIKKHGANSSMLHGYLRPHSPVMRTTKYGISKTLFPSEVYPTFLSGGGFMFPGPSVKVLHEVSQKIPVFPLDDVYFGFLALAANLNYRHDSGFHVYGLEFDPCLYQQVLVVHGIEKEDLMEYWEKVQNAQC